MQLFLLFNVMNCYVFVYGTLLFDFDNEVAVHLRNNAKWVGKATCQGLMYNMGDYPAVVQSASSKDVVLGEVYGITNDMLAKLDIYEEVGDAFPHPNEYVRKRMQVGLANAIQLNCWIYLYNHPTQNLEPILTGNYLLFKQMP